MRTFLGVIGLFVALFSLLLVATSAGDLINGTGGETPQGVLVGLLLFFSGTAAAGSYLARRMLTRPRRSEFEIEQAVLGLAAARGGRLTVAEVSTGCRLSVARARVALQRLCAQGVADLMMTDGAVEVFVFAGFLDAAEKATAQDVLDA